MDRIIYPKELGMVLKPFELYEIEQQMRITNQINENTFVYIDDENNVRIKEIHNLEFFYRKFTRNKKERANTW